jgi:hypothetical protein
LDAKRRQKRAKLQVTASNNSKDIPQLQAKKLQVVKIFKITTEQQTKITRSFKTSPTIQGTTVKRSGSEISSPKPMFTTAKHELRTLRKIFEHFIQRKLVQSAGDNSNKREQTRPFEV